jgi:hypothetical protein
MGDRVSDKKLSDLILPEAPKGDPRGEMRSYDPTARERMAAAIQAGIEGLGVDRVKARKHAETIMGGPSSGLPLGMGVADAVPFLGTAMGLEEGGRNLGEASDAIKRGDYVDAAANAVGAALGIIPGIGPTIKGAKAAGKGVKGAGRLAGKAVNDAMLAGRLPVSPAFLDVYHGSPHKFNKFDSSKIGTGEGAQAYGHGLYLAESPGVAEGYRKTLSGMLPDGWASKYPKDASGYIRSVVGDVASGMLTPEQAAKFVQNANISMRGYPADQLAAEIKAGAEATKGAFYKVDLPDEHIARMLDWDKPLSQQPEILQKVLDSPLYNRRTGFSPYPEMSGADLYGMGHDQVKSLGIPGIRYLDGGSRGTGAGTSNYVVFPGEEKNLTILERNGQPMIDPSAPDGMANGGAAVGTQKTGKSMQIDNSKKQSLKEWSMAGGGVPLQYKGREHVWHAKVKKFSAGGGVYNTVPDVKDSGDIIDGPAYGGGGAVKGLMGAFQKASRAADEMMGAQKVFPVAEREANKAKFLEQSKTPMVLYHGTTATEGGKGAEAIRRIKPSKEGALGSGTYLTPQPDRANLYTRSNEGGGNVLPVYAQIRNPLIIEGAHVDPMVEALTKLGMDEDKASRMVERAYENKGYIGKEVESRARAAGYDGLMQYRDGELGEVVAYRPGAVKSAIGNQGTYDTSSPDLSKAYGGEVHMGGGGAAGKKAVKEVIEGGVQAVKKLFNIADEVPKGVEPIVVQTPEERAVIDKFGQKVLPAAESQANLAKMLEKSKVKNRAYHATNQDVKRFDPKADKRIENKSNIAGWMTNDPEFANDFAAQKFRHWKTSNRPWEEDPNVPEGVNLMPMYLSIENPFYATDLIKNLSGELNMDEAKAVAKALGVGVDELLGDIPKTIKYKASGNEREHMPRGFDLVKSTVATDAMKRLGHDGVIAIENGSEVYAPFKETQIKSAIGNRGTYDLNDPDITKAHGGAVHMQKGGKSGALVSIAEAVAAASKKADEILAARKAAAGVNYADPLAPASMRMSEALGNAGAEGKTLNFTETDRSRVFGSNRGGVGFSGLQHYSLPHKKANTVWGFGNEKTAKKKILQNDPEKTIWTTFVGAPNQHRSNTVVLQDAVKEFHDAAAKGKVHPEQISLMNQRIRAAADENTGARLFDEAFDLTDPRALDAATTFNRRSAIGDVLLGEGVKGNMRRKDFKAKHGDQPWHDSGKMESVLKRETDPDLVDANTYDVGNRLFVMDNGIIHRPDLNVAFPVQVTGNDLGMKYELTPKEFAMRNWMKQYEGRVDKRGNPYPPNYMDLARNNPSQFVDEDFLTFLQKHGYKEGGEVHMDDGGNLDKAKIMAKLLAEAAQEQGSKEVDSLKKPRALTDLLNRGVIASAVGAPVDLINMGLTGIDAARGLISGKPVENKFSSDNPFGGSEQIKNMMNRFNMTSGEDRPIMETALSFLSPTAMIKGAIKAPGVVGKVTDALTPSKLAPLEAKTAQAGKPTGATYATKQEGPFFRVNPTNLDTSAAKTRGTKEAVGLPSSTPDGGGAEQSGREIPKFLSSEEVGRIIADPVANEPLNIAKKYTQDTQGVDFGVPQVPSSSLAKQSGIARTFDLAVQGSPEYKSAIFGAYGREMPDLMEKIGAKNYDDLMEKAYRQMAKETDEQFRRLPYNFSYHRAGEGNYNGAKDMASDVHGNKHLYVYQGGDKHDFLHNVDPQSGLNENEKFRAVHDLLGHAIYGNEFGPKGEEMAWAVHQQMYSPLARMAMTAETRGQNSVVNYSPLNAKLKATIAEYERLGNEALRRGDKKVAKEIAELKKQAYFGFEFAPNKAVLLPPEFMNPRFTGGIPDYLAAVNQPTPGTFIQSPLTHFSTEPGLTFTDPRKYGTGIKGAEADRLMNYPGAVRDRSYFYMGEPGTVSPEPGLGVNRYRGEASSLYDITQDPLDFSVLAREANRTPYTAKANQGLTYPLQNANDVERMVKEYGYQGMANPKATKPMAIMFKETPVRRQARGGLSSIK